MKKTWFSKATSWIIRILLLVIFIMAVAMLMLSTLGGTSDSHRKGLEQAFSDGLNADVEIARIKEFNVMPQLLMKAEGIHGIFRDTMNEFMADKADIAFSLSDLMTGRSRIEDFQLDNFRFSADSEYDLRVSHAGIKSGQAPAFVMQGQYNGRNFDMAVSMLKNENGRVSYYFDKSNAVSGHYGVLDLKGNLTPASGRDATIVDALQILTGSTVIATGKIIRDGKSLKVMLDCPKDAIPASAQADSMAVQKMPFVVMAQGCKP